MRSSILCVFFTGDGSWIGEFIVDDVTLLPPAEVDVLLSLATVPTYLTSRGYLSADSWIDQRCALSVAFGQHRNFYVRTDSGSGLFIKQIRQATPDLIAAQENEAMILSAIERVDGWSEQRSAVPRLIDHDRSRHVLVIEYIDGKNFFEAYTTARNPSEADRMTEYSSTIGKMLARFHQCGRQAALDANHPTLKTTLPVAVTLQPPDPNFFSVISPACRQMITSIQADEPFFRQLQANQPMWQRETVIHGDLKWGNLIVPRNRDEQIKFVDWELATFGDPAWDLAGVLQSYTVHTVIHPSTAGELTIPQRDADRVWSSYRQSIGDACDDAFADRVKKYYAARLVQTALEREYQSSSLSESSRQLLAISRQVLCYPHQIDTNPWAVTEWQLNS